MKRLASDRQIALAIRGLNRFLKSIERAHKRTLRSKQVFKSKSRKG
jgi:hypothetical protein